MSGIVKIEAGGDSITMAEIFRARSPHFLYRKQLQFILDNGQDLKVRGLRTREILNAVTVIEEPRRRVHCVPGRHASPFLALSEALWLLAGRNDVAALLPYNKHISDYSDDGETLYDAYGYRMRDQIPDLIERLRKDPNDRRAVLTIWQGKDLTAETKSPPCNDVVSFKLRDGRLHMTVFCRSNDLHWGLYAVNLPQFSILQEYLAARLHVEMGTQTHISNSLHIYLDGPGARPTKRMLAAMEEPLPVLPDPGPLFPWILTSHKEFVEYASEALDGFNPHRSEDPNFRPVQIPFLEFAMDFLRCYRDEESLEGQCAWADKFPDWIAWGENYLAVE